MNFLFLFLVFSGSLFSAIPNYAYITNFGGTSVTVVNSVDNSFVASLSGPPYNFVKPGYLTFSPDGKQILIGDSYNGGGEIVVINSTDSSYVTTIQGAGFNFDGIQYLQFSADGSKLYVSSQGSDTVTVIKSSDFSLIGLLNAGSGFAFDSPNTMILSNDGNRLFVTNTGAAGTTDKITVINTSTDTFETDLTGVGYEFDDPQQIAITPEGLLFVPNSGNSTVTILNSVSPYSSVTILSGAPYNFNVPVGCVLSPDKNSVYICNFMGNSVSVINSKSPFNLVESLTGGLSAPRFISFDPFAPKAYVTNYGTASVSVLDLLTHSFPSSFSYGFAMPALAVFNPYATPLASETISGCEFLFQTSVKRR